MPSCWKRHWSLRAVLHVGEFSGRCAALCTPTSIASGLTCAPCSLQPFGGFYGLVAIFRS